MKLSSRPLRAAVTGLSLFALSAAPALAEDTLSETDRLEADGRAAIADYQALLTETFIDTSDTTSDLSIVADILPAGFAITWDSAAPDSATGATTYSNLDLSYTSLGGTMGLKFDTAAIWGLDEEFLVARLAGERLDETATLASRIEATSVEIYGVSETLQNLIDMWIPEETQEEIGPFGVPQFTSTTDRLVIENFKLGTFAYTPMTQDQLATLDEDGEFNGLLPAIHGAQQVTAAIAAMGYDTAVSEGNSTFFQIIIPGEDTSFTLETDLTGTSGLMGFDVESSVGLNPQTKVITAYTESEEEPNIANFVGDFTLDQSEYAELSMVQGLRLNGLIRAFTTATLPDMSAKDLFSIGQFANFNGRADLNGDTIFTYETNRISAPSFTWLIPNQLDFEITNGTYDIQAVGLFLESLFDKAEEPLLSEDPDLYVRLMEGFNYTMALLPETGLNAVNFNFKGGLSWDAETGAMSLGYDWAAPEFGDERLSLSGKLPTYSQLQTLENLEGEAFEDAFAAMFVTGAAFNSLTWEQTDKGGYDKLMNFAVGFAKNYPEEEWGPMLSSMEPATMRAFASFGMRMAKTELPDDVPQAVNSWIDTVANYIMTSGGSLKIDIQPEQPITGLMFAMMSQSDDPSFIIDQLGITVTQTPEPRP